jgi:hypothetical protein
MLVADWNGFMYQFSWIGALEWQYRRGTLTWLVMEQELEEEGEEEEEEEEEEQEEGCFDCCWSVAVVAGSEVRVRVSVGLVDGAGGCSGMWLMMALESCEWSLCSCSC